MRTLQGVVLMGIVLLTPLPIQARWESARDSKSAAGLAAMTNEELFDEAFDVCVRRALLESLPNAEEQPRSAVTECNDYLNTIAPFVSERNGGRMPAWMTMLVAAHTTKECQAAFRMFLSKSEKPPAEDEAEGADGQDGSARVARPHCPPTTPKARPAQPRSHWSEQLPPWLAPQ